MFKWCKVKFRTSLAMNHVEEKNKERKKEKLAQRVTGLPNYQDASVLNHGCLLAKGIR